MKMDFIKIIILLDEKLVLILVMRVFQLVIILL